MKHSLSSRRLSNCFVPLISAAVLCFCAEGHAATIYRCGAAGNVYSDQPCSDGRLISASDERSEAQRTEGLRVAATERRFANDLQHARLLLAAAAPARAAGFDTAPKPSLTPLHAAPKNPKRHGKTLRRLGDEEDFRAIAPKVSKLALR